MVRYAALLRGVSPMNCKMATLAKAFGAAGFGDVSTVLSSGNVVFTSRSKSVTAIAAKAEKSMSEHLGRAFQIAFRPIDLLEEMLASDPYAAYDLAPGSKRVVTFLFDPVPAAVSASLPVGLDEAHIWCARDSEAFSSYVPTPNDPAFMRLIEKTFGKEVTTRTWDTVAKVVARSNKVTGKA